MFDVNGAEFLILVLVAVVVIGPRRLPGYAQRLGQLVRMAVHQLSGVKRRVDEEFATDGEPLHWEDYDPRRYDPRRIVTDALEEERRREAERSAAPEVPEPVRPSVVNTPADSNQRSVRS